MTRPIFAVHSYGMGSTWHFIVADSAEQVEKAFPQLQLFSDVPSWADGHTERCPVHILGDQHDPFLRKLTEERESLGALFGVCGEYMCVDSRFDPPDDELPIRSFMEVNSQRWATRQVDVYGDGRIEALDEQELANLVPARVPSVEFINEDPTFDAKPITREQFEEAWSAAGAEPD